MLIAIERVLTPDEVKEFRTQLEQCGDWESGLATAGTLAKAVKRNEQLPDQHNLAVTLGHRVLRSIAAKQRFVSAALPSRIYPPKFNRYSGGQTYGPHVDSALMDIPGTNMTVRSDLSATLFLSPPDTYEGGELQIEGPFGIQEVKLAAGDMVLYPSSSLHCVAPVTRGTRYASFFWIQSLVADEGARSLLFDLDEAIQALTPSCSDDDSRLLKLTGVYHNLLRRWAAP
ncbi:MAG: hypothetical protein RLZZ344_1143 [Pseudomonadota bacterium]|jgi:PKHD-type hydroxylase